jgi:hypothetical protein
MDDSVATQRPGQASSLAARVLVWIAWAWAIFLCWAGRREMLDDALIHLHYASILHDRHIISFDGVHPSYGASSLLYVAILALLRSAIHSPLLPKAVSLAAYAALLALVSWMARINRLAIALLLVLVSPFAVRWLTDGMETSLACLLAVAFAMLLARKASPAALALMALTLSLLRVDLTLLVAFGVLWWIDRQDWLRAAALCLGSAASLAFIRLTMGHLLPDTAIAKQHLHFFEVLNGTGYETAATFSFGIGAVLLWLVSAASAWRVNSRAALIANLPFPTLTLLAAVRGQEVNSIRYLIWALLFSITWNLLIAAAPSKTRPILLYGFACLLIVCWIFELPVALRIDRGRTQNLDAMQQAHLDRLHGQGLAADVGYISYFSQAPICDIDGLVNGRAAATMSYAKRTEACLAAQPTFLFVSALQMQYLDDDYHIDSHTDWIECGSVDFTNVGSSDRHWLLVRRTEYPQGCPAHL